MLQKERHNTRCRLNNFDDIGKTGYKKVTRDVVEACVRLITIHDRPLSLIDNDAFRNIIQIINFQKEKINSHKMRNAPIEQAIEVRRKIIEEIKGKLICLKVDAATCMGRSFLDINTQFMEDDKLYVRTLAVVELFRGFCYLVLIFVIICKIEDIDFNDHIHVICSQDQHFKYFLTVHSHNFPLHLVSKIFAKKFNYI